VYKGELGTANAHKILLKDIGKLFLPEAPVPHCLKAYRKHINW
jgi:hypothetical protein